MPRLAAPLVLVAIGAALVAGCGDSSSDETSATPTAPAGASATSCDAHAAGVESLRATNLPCVQARRVVLGWQRGRSCSLPRRASRGSCLTRSYRCQSTRTGRGLAVSCSRQGQSIAFLVKP
ncbi:MAG: hypothetical protein WA862_09450 [Solirubrobacterales bacterium]